jgi:uncharacterized protein (DUF362 family)
MERRRFLELTLAAGSTLLISGRIPFLDEGEARQEGASLPVLAVAEGNIPSRVTRGAIQALGGMSRFVGRGDVVVIKPNIGWDRTPEQAADTNPEVVATLVGMCLEAGAKRVKVFDHPVNDARRCYTRSGIAEAASRAGAEVHQVDPGKFKEIKIPGLILKSWPVYTEALEADRLINVPIAKHHSLSKLTLGLKNWMGIIGGRRSLLHQQIDLALADLAAAFKPDLVVLDAMRILIANGPQGGSLQDVRITNKVIAGVDQVAVDAWGATLFGLQGSDLGYLREAHRRGLGELDYRRLKMASVRV